MSSDPDLPPFAGSPDAGEVTLPVVSSSFQLALTGPLGGLRDSVVELPEDSVEAKTLSLAAVASDRIEQLRSSGQAAQQRYLFDGEIGRGGMGAVLRVFDADLRRKLAMKVVHSPTDDARANSSRLDPGRLMRFLEEAQVTGQLDHPGVVPVHELGVDADGRVYFTMRLVRGEELAQVFDKVHARDPAWNQTRALGLLLKVCEAMSYAHDKGVVHRDLKPANVMVGRHGEVYVMDWGVARVDGREDSHDMSQRSDTAMSLSMVETDRRDAAQQALDSPIMTMDGSVMGTPYYMPPEQAAGRQAEVGPHSDVYALGAMLYHLLTGRMPYHAPGDNLSAHTILAMVLQGPPRPVNELAPETPAELQAICEQAMARETSKRYADMGELADDLRAYMENRVVLAHRTGAVVELRKWVQRNKALAAAIVAIVVLTVGGSTSAALVLGAKNEEIRFARDEALEAKQLAEQARAASESVTRFLVGQFEALEPEATRGRPLQVNELLDSAAVALAGELESSRAAGARLRGVVGGAYLALGRYTEAEPLLERAWQQSVEHYGEDAAETLAALNELAVLYQDQGRLDEAESRYAQVLEKRRATLGENHPGTLASQSDLASVYQDQGQYAEAEDLYRSALERSRAVLGEDDADTMTLLYGLAGVYQDQDRFDEAEPLFAEVLERSRATLGEDHPDTITALHNLAELYHDQRRYPEASPLYARSLELSRAVLGEEHPDTLMSLYGLGSLYQDQGRFELAEPLLQQALERSRAVLGDEHPVTLTALYLMAGLLHDLYRFAEAEPLYLLALERSRAVLGADHPDTLLTVEDLEVLYEEWLPELRREQGADHPDTLRAMLALARLCASQDKFQRAETLLRKCLEQQTEALGESAPETLLSMQALAELLADQERWEAAEPLAHELLQRTPERTGAFAERTLLLERVLARRR